MSAFENLNLYSEDDPAPGLQVNWYVKNTSIDKAIRFTILFWRGQIIFGDKWTKIFDIEPGEIKMIGIKEQATLTTINAQIRGARYII